MKKKFLGLCTSLVLLGFSHYPKSIVSATPAVTPLSHLQHFTKQFEDSETEALVIDAIQDHPVNSDKEDDLGVSSSLLRRRGKQFSAFGQPLYTSTYFLPDISENENIASSFLSQTFDDGSCVTNQGSRGNCEAFEKCFPLLNLPEDKNGNETSNYKNLMEEVYQLSVDRKCSSVVHAGKSEFSNVCCDFPPNPTSPKYGLNGQIPMFYDALPPMSQDEILNEATTPKYTKIVNTWATCGERQFKNKIIGGQEAMPHQYPWMVSIWGRSGKHICGGALLDNNFVLTAAHCVARYTSQDIGQIRLLIGDHNIHSTSDGHHEVRSVGRIIKHKRFSFKTFVHDIALLKLDRPVPFTDKIRPICLPTGVKRVEDDPELLVAGWGQTAYQGASSSILKKVTVSGVSNQKCQEVYNVIAQLGITNEMVCAGGDGVDSCIGDSGGPLIQFVNNRYEQVGIVSFGRECGTYPGVYTRVHSYLNWINVNRNKH